MQLENVAARVACCNKHRAGMVWTFMDKLWLIKIIHKLHVFGGKKRHELKRGNEGKTIENKGFCGKGGWLWAQGKGVPGGGGGQNACMVLPYLADFLGNFEC